MKKWLKITLLFLSINISFLSVAQTNSKQDFVASGDIFGRRVFIENKGQYDNVPSRGQKVLYALENGNEKIFFTSTGVIYQHIKPSAFTIETEEKEREREAQGKEESDLEAGVESDFVYMNWIGSTKNISAEATEKQNHYFTYGSEKQNAGTFKKITYKNVYNKIDVEYLIPNNRAFGIKYNVILHPGADFTLFKMAYTGDIEEIKLIEGEIKIKSPIDEITEYAPNSFYFDGEKISSEYKLEDNIVSFALNTNLNPNKKLIIDPWVTAVTTLSANNNAYDVDYDYAGNTYIYGGSASTGLGRHQVAKYNTGGSLLWTFSGTLSIGTPTWGTGGNWPSNFLVQKALGQVYISRVLAPGPFIVRINTSGNYDNFFSQGPNNLQEVWGMDFTCNGNLIAYGGGTTTGGIVSVNTGSMTQVSTFSPGIIGCCQDIISYTKDDTGDPFVFFEGHTNLSDQIAKVSQSFTNSAWRSASGITGLAYLQNKNFYSGVNPPANAYNALAVNQNFLYCYDGRRLVAYNKLTGAITGSINTALTARYQGGIAVDDCDNVYIGGNGNILCYHFGGASFSTLTPIAITASVTNRFVYDLVLNRATKQLFVSGSGFVGSYSAIHSLTCAPVTVSNQCTFGQPVVQVINSSINCLNSAGSATIQLFGGTGPCTYTWLAINQTGSVVSGLGPGFYTVVANDAGANFTYTNLISLNPIIPFTGNFSATFSVPCFGSSTGTASISNISGGTGSQNYLWTNGSTVITTPTITNLSAGNYTLTVTDASTNCQFVQYFQISQPSLITTALASSNPVACTGQNFTLTATLSGGVPPYNINWLNGPSSQTWITSNITPTNTIYSLTGIDANSCAISGTINQLVSPTPTITVNDGSICVGNSFTIQANGAQTYTFEGGTNTVMPNSTSSYTVSGTSSAGCIGNTALCNVTVFPNPTISVNNGTICSGENFTILPSGASIYTIQGGNNIVSPNVSSTYSVTGISNDGCPSVNTATCNLIVKPTPTISVNSGSICSGSSFSMMASGAITFTVQGGNPVVSPTITSIYAVAGSSMNGCVGSASCTVFVYPITNLSIYADKDIICKNEVANLIVIGANSYTWNTASTSTMIIVAPMATSIYTVSGTNNNGCISKATFTLLVDICEGINDLKLEKSWVFVYPNPNKIGVLYINTQYKASLTLFDSLGRIIQKKNIGQGEYPLLLENYSKGVYFLIIESEQGKKTLKLISE